MSDTPQAPDWFKASDGKWYPPQGQAGAPPQQPLKKKGGCLKFGLIALGVLIVLGVLATALGGGGSKSDTASNDTSSNDTATSDTGISDNTASTDTTAKKADSGSSTLFPGRPDAKKGDKERNIGSSADLSGYTVTVNAAGFQQEISQFEKKGYLVADVTIMNRDEKAQSYNSFEWKLVTPGGTIIDPTFTTEDQLGSGDLVKGGTVSGKLHWEVGATKGDYYVIYDPTDLGSERAVWKTTV